MINGSGTQVLSGSNSYTGATTITSGTLELGNVNAVQGSIVTDNAAMDGLAFAASGATYNVGGLSGSGNISLLAVSGGSLTLNVNGTSTTTTTYSGALKTGRRRVKQRRQHTATHQFQQQLHRSNHDHGRGPGPGQYSRLDARLVEFRQYHRQQRRHVRRDGRIGSQASST